MQVIFDSDDMLSFASEMMDKEKGSLKLVGQKSVATSLDLQNWMVGNRDNLKKVIKVKK